MMKIIELWPRPEFGPSSRNRFGKPFTATPRCASTPSRHASWIFRPFRPTMRAPSKASVTWKPVPKTMASTSCSRPSRVTIERGRTSAMPSVVSSTLGRVRAG
ncbi:hypothetical protein ACFQY7_25430 [Actinomadura luteofluorescens]|uniref:hypothetical protein n=1 Tax=Actinomadura luteofluorescens TaxID=46163 RepID=UPI00362C3746